MKILVICSRDERSAGCDFAELVTLAAELTSRAMFTSFRTDDWARTVFCAAIDSEFWLFLKRLRDRSKRSKLSTKSSEFEENLEIVYPQDSFKISRLAYPYSNIGLLRSAVKSEKKRVSDKLQVGCSCEALHLM